MQRRQDGLQRLPQRPRRHHRVAVHQGPGHRSRSPKAPTRWRRKTSRTALTMMYEKLWLGSRAGLPDGRRASDYYGMHDVKAELAAPRACCRERLGRCAERDQSALKASYGARPRSPRCADGGVTCILRADPWLTRAPTELPLREQGARPQTGCGGSFLHAPVARGAILPSGEERPTTYLPPRLRVDFARTARPMHRDTGKTCYVRRVSRLTP